MKVTIEKQEENLSLITIETEPGRAKAAYKDAARKLGNHINIPGFRKGKAPIKVIEAHIGIDHIKNETMNMYFLSELLYEAFDREHLHVMFIPAVEDVDFKDPEGPVKLRAKIELYPDVVLGDYKNIEVTAEVPKFEKEKYVQNTLEKLAKDMSIFEEISEDDSINMGDEVVFDFEGKIKNSAGEAVETWESLPELKATNYQTIVEKGRFIENFLEQLVGMKKDGEKDIQVKFPDDYAFDKVCGKDAIFSIKIHKVLRPKVLPIDDELAKRCECSNLDELKEKIIFEMNRIDEQNKKYASSEAVLNRLLEICTVDVNDRMAKREVQSSMEKIKNQYNLDDAQFKDFLKGVDMNKESDLAKRRLAKSLILTQIIKQENLIISPKELDEGLQDLLSKNPNTELKKADLDSWKKALNSDLLVTKAIEFVVNASKVEFNYVGDTQAEEHVHGPHCRH